MARKPVPPSVKPPLELAVSRDEAKERLTDRIEKGRELMQRQVNSQETYKELEVAYGKWSDFNSELLRRLFTSDELASEYSYAGHSGSIMLGGLYGPSLGQEIASTFKTIEGKIHGLDSIIERLELIPLASATTVSGEGTAKPVDVARTNRVFVVHGRDEAAKTGLEAFLREIGLDPVVLHRQADEGMTVIEKFEKHSDVGYAFILLTPDEVAYLASEETKPDEQRIKERRARPNVIFEFGYFVGKLGRNRVCCLYTGNVTLPSDVGGMIYKQYQKSLDEVAYPIIKDLKAAGYSL